MHLKVEDIEAPNYDVIDVETNTVIPAVQEANDETGEITLLLRDIDGNIIFKDEEAVCFRFKGNIKLVKKQIKEK
jgi:uncharacterized protein YgbK (DUF1537 family)